MTGWDPSEPSVVAWIERAVGEGARLLSVEAMPASSTEKHAMKVSYGGSEIELILRRYHDRGRPATDWYDPAIEARALHILERTEVPAPHLLGADLDAEICDVPALLETRVPGEQAWQPDDLDAYLTSAAEVLVALHAVNPDAAAELPPYRTYVSDDYPSLDPTVPAWSERRRMWERAFAIASSTWPATPSRFIHRDYHPGNALWDGDAVHGVVDWATAARGPAGIDLARLRQNLAGWHGAKIADVFTERYVAVGGDPAARDPFWDLLDAVDSVASMDEPGAPGDGDADRFEDYVARVLAEH